MLWPKRVLMVRPDFYDISYAINPHMSNDDGSLKKIDHVTARTQWEQLYLGYKNCGLQVEALDGQPGLPDMVFCANQMFPFPKNGHTQFVLSRMRSVERQDEVKHLQTWAVQKNLECFTLPEELTFEAMGDAIWNYETGEIFGGHGFRTDVQVYDWLEMITEKPVIRLQLVDSRFYHLDTALSLLNANTALFVREAFSDESFEKLKMKFKNLWRVPVQEAESCLAANAFCLDGKNVFVESQALFVQKILKENGFRVHTFNTSEYLKAGGSIFCLKLMF